MVKLPIIEVSKSKLSVLMLRLHVINQRNKVWVFGWIIQKYQPRTWWAVAWTKVYLWKTYIDLYDYVPNLVYFDISIIFLWMMVLWYIYRRWLWKPAQIYVVWKVSDLGNSLEKMSSNLCSSKETKKNSIP